MSEPAQIYDRIGENYAGRRRSDPFWERRIHAQLDGVDRLVNIGAGAGSYEPEGKDVVAVEPSRTMIRQRSPDAAPAVCAVAEALPFPDACFDAAMAILTLHHWRTPEAGLREMRRVSRRQLLLTWDPIVFAETFWLVRDYLPGIAVWERGLATLERAVAVLDPCRVIPMPVPAHCADGVLGAYWQRPERYLEAASRASMSGLALLDQSEVADAMARLAGDLADGSWRRRYAGLMPLKEIDLGYRLVVASS